MHPAERYSVAARWNGWAAARESSLRRRRLLSPDSVQRESFDADRPRICLTTTDVASPKGT